MHCECNAYVVITYSFIDASELELSQVMISLTRKDLRHTWT